MSITYPLEPNLTPDESVDVLGRSTLAERRPVDQPDVIQRMLTHADIVITARVDDLVVGVSRAITKRAAWIRI